MKSVKILDHRPSGGRRRELWAALGGIGVFPVKMHDSKGAFFPIVRIDELEKLLTEDAKKKMKDKGYEVVAPIEWEAMKSVVVRELDSSIRTYDQDEIDSIERLNNWAKVDSVYVFKIAANLMKIIFRTSAMALQAQKEGIIINNKFIPSKRVEKEIFVRLDPCRNCFSYNHETKHYAQNAVKTTIDNHNVGLKSHIVL